MTRPEQRRIAFAMMLPVLLLAGCAASAPSYQVAALDRPSTIDEIARGVGYGSYAPLWRSGYERALAERAAVLSGSPMSVENALEIGLLADPGMRGLLQEIGFERAGTIEHLAEGRAAEPASFEWRLIDFLMRNRNAGSREGWVSRNTWAYGELYADVAHAVLEKANAIRRAYYEAVAAGEIAALHERLADAARATAELANEQYRSGTASRLEQAQRQLAYVETLKDSVAARREATRAREALNVLLRLQPAQAIWALPDRLPELPAERPELPDVAAIALASRPEALSAGVADAGSPIGARIVAEACDAYDRMLTAYDTARFQREQVLPVANVMLEETQLHYNAMLEDVYALIEAGQKNIEAGKEYVENAAAFWVAHAELADMLGGAIPRDHDTAVAADGSVPATN